MYNAVRRRHATTRHQIDRTTGNDNPKTHRRTSPQEKSHMCSEAIGTATRRSIENLYSAVAFAGPASLKEVLCPSLAETSPTYQDAIYESTANKNYTPNKVLLNRPKSAVTVKSR